MDTYIVKNRSASTVVYNIPEDRIRRSFAPGEAKRISADELRKLGFQPGGIALMEQYLQVFEDAVRQELNLRTEPEYDLQEAQIIDLIKTGPLDAFLDALDYAPAGVIELIKKYSCELPITDMAKRRALKEKTGFDVDAAIRHTEEEKEVSGEAASVQPTASHRRTAPNYKIVTPKQ